MTNSATSTASTGTPVELGRYDTEAGERILVGRRIDGEVRVYDCPLPGRPGRTYFVESGFESKAELAMLVADYRRQAEELGAPPMSAGALDELLGRAKETLS